jgi:hypothetical protein
MFEFFSPEFLDLGRWAWSAFLWRNPQRQRFEKHGLILDPAGQSHLDTVTPQWAIQKYPENMYSIYTLFISHQYPIHITSISYSYPATSRFFFTPPRLEGHWRGGKPSISAESGDHPDLWWSMDSVATSRHERLRLHPTLRRRLGGYGARQHARPGEGSPPALHHGPGLCWVAEVSIPVCDEHRGKSGDSVAI